jgi:hypothetical protein
MRKITLFITGMLLLLLSSCNLPEEYNFFKKDNVSEESTTQQSTNSEIDPDKVKPPTGG